MYENFTDRARKVMQLMHQEAHKFNHKYVGTEHILLGLVKEGNGLGCAVITQHGIDLRKVRLEVEKLVQDGPDRVTMGKLPITPRANRAIKYTIEQARLMNEPPNTSHILLGLLMEREGVAAQVLINLGMSLEKAKTGIDNLVVKAVASAECVSDEPKEKDERDIIVEIMSLLNQLEPHKAIHIIQTLRMFYGSA